MKPSPRQPVPATLDPLALEPGAENLPQARRWLDGSRAGVGLTADGRLRSGKLAGLTMRRAIWVLSWPILAESVLNSMVGLTDTILAAQISQAATDAIGAASYMMWFVGLIAMAVGIGATALVSRAIGASRLAVANAATGQAVLLAAVSGAGAGLMLYACAGPSAALMNLSAAGTEAYKNYLAIVWLGVPALAVMSAGIACARGAGDSKRPLAAMVVVNLVNIVVSWLLAGCDYTVASGPAGSGLTRTLVHNPSPLDLGVEGVAWGTVAGEYIGMAIVLAMLTSGRSGVVLLRRRLRPHMHTIRRIVRVAMPSFLETAGMWLGNFAVILVVGLIARTQGEGVMGAHIVAIRIEAFSFLPGFAIGTAAAALVGQYLGAGSRDMARRAVLWCTGLASGVMGLTGVLFVLAPGAIVGLVTTQPAHLKLAPELILITGFVQVPFAVSIVMRSALRGAGDTRAVMVIVWICTYLVRLPLVVILAGVAIPLWPGREIPAAPGLTPSLTMLWIGLCGEIVLRAALLMARFAQGRWAEMRV